MLSKLETFLVEECGVSHIPQGMGEQVAINYIDTLRKGEVKRAVQAAQEAAMAQAIEVQLREKALDKAIAVRRWWTPRHVTLSLAAALLIFLRGTTNAQSHTRET